MKLAAFAALALVAVSAAAEGVPVPASTCTKPVIPAGDQPLLKVAADKLNAESKVYQTCVTAYHNARKAVVDEHNAIAQAHADAARKSDEDFNVYVDALNASIAARDKASKAVAK